MKRARVTVVVCFMLSLTLTTMAQDTATLPDAREVIAKFVEATGGEANYRKLKSIHAKGKMSVPAQNIEGTVDVIFAAGGKSRQIVEIAGLGVQKIGGDGETYWSESNFTGVRILEGDERGQQARDADLHADLHPEKYFKSMKVTGTEKVGDEECYRVERVHKSGSEQVDFYSIESGLHLKSIMSVATPLGKIKIETMPSDYRKVGDVLMAFKSEQKLPGNMTQVIAMESIKANEDLPPETFDLPEKIKQLKKSK